MQNKSLKDAERLLSRRDPVLKLIIKRHGPCTMSAQPVGKYFDSLADAIISQQISVRAAATIFARFKKLLRGRISAQGILRLSDAELKTVGISPQKMAYLRDLSKCWQNGTIKHRTFANLPDEEVIKELVMVKGIGRWTAEMFLMFSLGRLDVLPVADLGLQNAIQKAYGFKTRPSERTIRRVAEQWKPYRSIGTWYLWTSLADAPPRQSKGESRRESLDNKPMA